ncbi:MAG: GreA/GreB family elongation factor, partial [Clostridia bacterium]|nr:GreA/GreB family elongation factor [Clostridia bacterium]
REKRRNEGRIRYLKNMIRTARVITLDNRDGRISLFDRVTIFNEKLGKEKEIQLVTTLRQNALLGFVSKESPLGEALMGKRVGDRVLVKVSDSVSYYVRVVDVKAGEDNEDLPISGY